MSVRWMKKTVSLDTTDWLYRRRKHFCPTCRGRLRFVRVYEVVDPASREAHKYGQKVGSTLRIGMTHYDKPFRAMWRELSCPACRVRYPIGVIIREESRGKR